jgi:sec-independent protein translocase protein TatA
MVGMFGSSEMVIVLVIVLVLFGGSQLPKLAKNLGKAQKEFKAGMEEADKDDTAKSTAKEASASETSAAEKNSAD